MLTEPVGVRTNCRFRARMPLCRCQKSSSARGFWVVYPARCRDHGRLDGDVHDVEPLAGSVQPLHSVVGALVNVVNLVSEPFLGVYR